MTHENRRIRIAISLAIAIVAGLIVATMVIPNSHADDGGSPPGKLPVMQVPATDRPVVKHKTVKIEGLGKGHRPQEERLS